jgi:hypothetical protein
MFSPAYIDIIGNEDEVYFSQVIPDDVHIDARLFAVRSAKHVCIEIFLFATKIC